MQGRPRLANATPPCRDAIVSPASARSSFTNCAGVGIEAGPRTTPLAVGDALSAAPKLTVSDF
jgi:hypothetical protein